MAYIDVEMSRPQTIDPPTATPSAAPITELVLPVKGGPVRGKRRGSDDG